MGTVILTKGSRMEYSTHDVFKEPESPKPVKKVNPFEYRAQAIAESGIPSVVHMVILLGSIIRMIKVHGQNSSLQIN
jgi:hypothetical protein